MFPMNLIGMETLSLKRKQGGQKFTLFSGANSAGKVSFAKLLHSLETNHSWLDLFFPFFACESPSEKRIIQPVLCWFSGRVRPQI